jgi:O-antigen/teichoic acid export membrane protein
MLVQTGSAILALLVLGLQHFVLARLLGPVEFGIYGLALAVQHLVLLVQEAGFRTLIYREQVQPTPGFGLDVSQLQRAAFGHAIAVTAVAAPVCAALYRRDGTALAMGLAVLGGLSKACTGIIGSVLLGGQEFIREARWQSVQRALATIAALALAALCRRADAVLLALAVVPALALLPIFHTVRIDPPKPTWHTRAYSDGFALTLLAILTALYFRIGTLFLWALHHDPVSVSQYTLVHRLLDAAVILMAPLAQLIFYIARSTNGASSPKKYLLPGLSWVAFVLLAVLTASIWGPDAMVAFAGEPYRASGKVLPWVAGALAFSGPSFLLTQLMLARNRQWSVVAPAAVAAIASLPLNWLLISNNGAVGAAQALLVAEVILFFGLVVGWQSRLIGKSQKAGR